VEDFEIFIDIFVGRHPEEILYMKQYFQQHYRPSKGQNPPKAVSLATAVANMHRTNNLPAQLIHALTVCVSVTRPLDTDTVDQDLVNTDVTEIQRILSTAQLAYLTLFGILLYRSDAHIKQIATVYEERENRPLEEGIRRCRKLTMVTNKIAEHAVRSAMDRERRDLMLLRRAIGAESIFGRENAELLALRIVRAHWYRNHWIAVRKRCFELNKESLASTIGRRGGSLEDVLVSLASKIIPDIRRN
jgi:hypothetical protein